MKKIINQKSVQKIFVFFLVMVFMFGMVSSSSSFLATTPPMPWDGTFPAKINEIFPDPELASFIGSIVHKNIVTQEDLDQVTIIDSDYYSHGDAIARKYYISNLEGIQYLNNLKEISIYHYSHLDYTVSDISLLSSVNTLEKVYFFYQNISDISVFKDIPNLKSVSLHGLPVDDYSVLWELVGLESLRLGSTEAAINVDNISVFKNLKYLSLTDITISNLSFLSGKTDLTYLQLYNCGLKNLDLLSNFTNLEELYLDDNNISNIDVLSKLKNLKKLSLYNNNISNIEALAGLNNLVEINIGNNNVFDFSFLPTDKISYIYANNQMMTSDVVYVENGVLTIENPIKLDNFFGKHSHSFSIIADKGGVYDEEYDTITWRNLSDSGEVSFEFNSYRYNIGRPSFYSMPSNISLGGKVVIPYTDEKREQEDDNKDNPGSFDYDISYLIGLYLLSISGFIFVNFYRKKKS